QVCRRAPPGYPQPVSGRVLHAGRDRRIDGRAHRLDDRPPGPYRHAGADGSAGFCGPGRCHALGRGRSVLRDLSGATRIQARSHRSSAGGTMTSVELFSAIGLALNTVREHKLRSFLTVLGVIIGTGTIIGVGSIIAGLDGAVT